MGISVYYTAVRSQPLSKLEKMAIQKVERDHDVSALIDVYEETGEGYSWESFTIYEETDEGVIFEGATKLPANSAEAVVAGLEHWLKALTQIRLTLTGATWKVQVEDDDVPWNEEVQAFDISLMT